MDKSELPNVNLPRGSSGLVNGESFHSDDLQRHLPVYHIPTKGGEPKTFPLAASVVARIDSWSKTQKINLPAVIAVGINPGGDSQENRAMAATGIYADLKIRSRLEEAFKLALTGVQNLNDHNPVPAADSYHLIATYLFPWLTTKSWKELEMGSMEECLLQHGLGYDDPLAPLKLLLTLLEKPGNIKTVSWVVFHGVSPLIPLTATRFAQERNLNGPDILVCDELRGKVPIHNSVMLDRPPIDRSHVDHLPVDE